MLDRPAANNFHKTAMQNKVNYVKNEVLSRPATATFEDMTRDLGFERRKSERQRTMASCMDLDVRLRLVVAEARDKDGPIMVAHVFRSSHTPTDRNYRQAGRAALAGDFLIHG
ncbi:hypothetical protein SPRG_15717 [Saprolegnia parasitica CBS 223.65]|uniref:Uncharacterized protein n=1 Tax=Saprolegnia parasitica (strain CBS 223.65) TaxID=695850 RepID=A0A067BQU9_SAPPC|nr:hypothetical protein SPRG_15717 [Saprolegnia parasitica CBS 223.65]KDO19150.1 hypothetical protein SPRG_15717 [Saprolegnia parasitica CBS 223.65]|eukprot:XP_012210148.1 hypothetical protein SPRG_15717 [Saprolegnia parasitica CBS 223.65]